ncbi:hypothetical protein [Paraburkholderia bannensis]|uniref:hypothetical protein n=1 Tax=Paraburkholderia bannensis TaxID=765414 RepID=UPI002ABE2CCD|nr:hypothetical protein [Paraburkholderia bannensis]
MAIVGAGSLESFKAIDFASPQSVQGALANHTAQPIAGGSVVCAVVGAGGYFDYAKRVKVPGRPVDLWIGAQPDHLAPAD